MDALQILRQIKLKDLTDGDRALCDELYLQLSTSCSCCHGVDKSALGKVVTLQSKYLREGGV